MPVLEDPGEPRTQLPLTFFPPRAQVAHMYFIVTHHIPWTRTTKYTSRWIVYLEGHQDSDDLNAQRIASDIFSRELGRSSIQFELLPVPLCVLGSNCISLDLFPANVTKKTVTLASPWPIAHAPLRRCSRNWPYCNTQPFEHLSSRKRYHSVHRQSLASFSWDFSWLKWCCMRLLRRIKL